MEIDSIEDVFAVIDRLQAAAERLRLAVEGGARACKPGAMAVVLDDIRQARNHLQGMIDRECPPTKETNICPSLK